MDRALSSQRVLAGYAVLMTLLLAAHYALPGLWIQTLAVIELSGVAAMAAGVAANRPARRAPWLLLMAANLSAALGRLSVHVPASLADGAVPFPSFADAVYLSEYPLYIAGIALFIWPWPAGRDVRTVIDALILAVGVALLSWLFLIVPGTANPSLDWLQWSASVAYPVADLIVLAMLARLLAPVRARGPSAGLLALGAVGAVASDVAYDLLDYAGSHHEGMAVGAGWLVCYVAWGAAALHPSMTELTRRGEDRAALFTPAGVTVLMLASLIAPGFLLIRSLLRHDAAWGVIAAACTLLYLLMLCRLWDVASSHRRGLNRERALRLVGASLASATSPEEIAVAIQSAAETLVGFPRVIAAPRPWRGPAARRGPGRGDGQRAAAVAVLAIRDAGRLRAVGAARASAAGAVQARISQAGAAGGPFGDRLRELAESLLPGLDRPRFVAAAEFGDLVPGSPRPGTREGVLLCPLTLSQRPAGDPHIGVLAVYGRQRTLAGLTAALEILAGQAALAVERTTLTQEVIRQRGEALFRTLVQDTSDAILIISDDGTVRYATPSAASIFGAVAVEGTPLADLVGPGTREDVRRVLDLIRARASGGTSPGFLLRIERLDGDDVMLEVRFSDLRDDRTVSGLVLTLRDVTEQHQLEEELKHQAFHDALTGLPNRVLFARRAADSLSHAARTGQTAGVLFVDLDDFKVVNDTMGHGAGDALLVAVAERLAASVRSVDTAARLGGDEFALLIDAAADPAAVEAFAERIVSAFTAPFPLDDASVVASVSVGVATSADSGNADELLRHADLALYAAKAAGKRRWRRYQPALSAGMLRRREVQAALEEAVQDSAFSIVYQPIASLVSGEIAGFEALVRWKHPRWGVILPGQFIELAEETGHIVPLGDWVLSRALADVASWRGRLPPSAREILPPAALPAAAFPAKAFPAEPFPATELQAEPFPDEVFPAAGFPDGAFPAMTPAPHGPGPARPYVSVNVSARQFRDPGFVDGVRSALRASGLPPSALLLELTESIVVGGSERVRADLAELKRIGVRLAIDDFGTGYSSLSYLLELPIDVLKIDKAFVTGIAASRRRHALVEGIVRLAATLDVDVVAEGIETEEERQLLAGMGCQHGQGYLLSTPVGAFEAEGLLRLGRGLVPALPAQRRKPPAKNYLTDL